MGRGRSCYIATLGNNGFILFCCLFLAGYLVHGAIPYDYSATIECIKQPLDPQYGGGLIANPGFDKGIEAWEVDGRCNNTKSELRVDSVSLKEFTKHEWQENRLKKTEKVRKRKLRVNVANKNGKKIQGAKIEIEQRKLQFVIGCATPASILMSKSYQKWFVSRFTTAVFDNEMKWYYTEGLQGHENYSTPDAMLKFFEDHGIDVRGHNILWGAETIQRWVKDLPPRQLLSESVRRMGSVMSRYAGKLVAWDVVNENLHHPLFEERLGKNASAIFYKIASSLDSRATMFLNEFNTLEHPGDMVSIPSKYVEKLQEIKAFPGNEELVIGIGLQGHFDSHPNIPYIRAVFDVLGETKMPIWLTELNVESCPKQAYFLEEIMREAFAHPAVKGMMIWIGWKPDECNEMCLLNSKLQNSPSGEVVDKLLAEWKTTNVTGVSDNAGAFEVKVFHGDYHVTVYNPNTGANVTKEVQVYDDKSETLDVSITL
ncbi:hypothetical protein RND71_041498 [Anisodus tanguticus]|uniref:GH10 domain-containing protein n=1 Tax=Anisodus tanguticus TaxID=243964 RepID=A0AAE1QVC7_9SOLA|nr:hypothetical protein RND71_041498 [Anisodus tanguticus]